MLLYFSLAADLASSMRKVWGALLIKRAKSMVAVRYRREDMGQGAAGLESGAGYVERGGTLKC